jgi:hypothetical protein
MVSYLCHRHVVGVYLSFKSYQLKKEKRKNERKCFLVWQLNEKCRIYSYYYGHILVPFLFTAS